MDRPKMNFYTLLLGLKVALYNEVPTSNLPVILSFEIRKLDFADFKVVDLRTNKAIFTSIYNLEKALDRRWQEMI